MEEDEEEILGTCRKNAACQRLSKVCMDEAPRTVFLLDAAGNSLADTDFRRLFVHFSRGAMYMIYT